MGGADGIKFFLKKCKKIIPESYSWCRITQPTILDNRGSGMCAPFLLYGPSSHGGGLFGRKFVLHFVLHNCEKQFFFSNIFLFYENYFNSKTPVKSAFPIIPGFPLIAETVGFEPNVFGLKTP